MNNNSKPYLATDVSTDVAKENEKRANRDPLTGQPGAHPVATGLGTAIGAGAGIASAAALGAASGAVLGPVGIVVGSIVGGIFGAGVGHQVGEDIHPTQIAWWRANYDKRPYVKKGADFSQYEPAYWYGLHASSHSQDSFENLEPNLRNNWLQARGDSTLEWEEAKPATQDAYERIREGIRKGAA